jgi:hypothetical protein
VIPSKTPKRPPLRLLVSFAALLVLLPASARADRGIEITPFAGFRFGGGLQEDATGADLPVGERESFGLILDIRASPDTQYELFYSLQRTELEGRGLFGGDPLFDLDIHYLHVGGTYLFPGETVRPFLSGGLGLTFLVPDGPGLGSRTRFSLSLGGGAKIPFSKGAGLRLEGRGFLTVLPDRTEIFCVSSGEAVCDVRVQGDVLAQFELLAGISFGF